MDVENLTLSEWCPLKQALENTLKKVNFLKRAFAEELLATKKLSDTKIAQLQHQLSQVRGVPHPSPPPAP